MPKKTFADAERERAITSTAPVKPKTPPKLPPRPELPQVRDLNTFAEGSKVNIQGCPNMQNLTIERISDSGVTVSGGGLPPSTVLSGKSPALLVVYTQPPTGKEPGVQVIAPYPGHGNFSSAKGGTAKIIPNPHHDDGTDPVPAKERLKAAATGATESDLPPRITRTGGKREGVCAFIDARIMEGGRSVEEILALVLAQFPGRDPKATTSTIKTRPSHIKARHEVPPPFRT